MRCVFLALLFSCASFVNADDRLPIPDETAQQEADELVQTVFGERISAAKRPDAKSTLTKKLLEESAAPDATPAGRYAMLKAALDVAPDATTAMSIIDEMAKHFQIDELRAKAYTIKKISESANTTSERKSLAESTSDLADAYIKQDNFTAASALVEIALEAATASRDSQLIREIQAKQVDVSSWQRKYADVKLALATLDTDPADAKSNLVVGKYKCFVKGAWDDGLPMLALGGDEAMNLEAGEIPLVLLCPAWKKYGAAKTVKPNRTILHSRQDDVVPFEDSEELVHNCGLPDSALIETGSEHRLADPEPLAKMLEACGRVA